MCDVFDTLPQWIQDTIEESFELKAAKDSEPEPRPASTAAATDNLETISEEGSQGLKDDEIPF
jgi:hypothetical protein